MPTINFHEKAGKALEILSKGAFLTTAADGQTNTMTIAWGSIGFMWNKPVFTVLVRPSRHTFQLIERSAEFTVSIPLGDMQQALTLCGTKSGRDMDKIAAAGLTLSPGKEVATPVIGGCGLYYECKVLYKQTMTPVELAPETNKQCYANGDYHTFYFGEIVAAYTD